ncbi:hypothetical protein RIF29_19220 [Crotalaria pallida]|uniref:Uncharacterized protein n=1 Tax=Crotalaria pallida TaxID=3830 RepID=A0AAN9F0D0_CROPI
MDNYKGHTLQKEVDEASSSKKNSAWLDLEALKREVNNIVLEKPEFVDTLEYEDDILGASMESWLKRFAVMLTNTEPTFLKESAIMEGSRVYCRYHVLMNTNIIGENPFTIGRYAESDFFAREDAAVQMIRRYFERPEPCSRGVGARKRKELQRDVPSKGRSNQNQMDSESANVGLIGGNITDGDEALASGVATQSDTTPSNIVELVESLQRRVRTLEDHDDAHTNSIKLLELILLKNKGVDRADVCKVTHDGEKDVINLEDGNKDVEGNVPLVHAMFQRTQTDVYSPPTLDFPPEMYANCILQVSDEDGSDRTNTFSTPNLKLSNLHWDSSGAPRTSKRRRFATNDVVIDLGRNIFPSPTSKQQTPSSQTKSRVVGEMPTNSTQNPSSKSASKGKGVATASTLIKQNVRPKSVTIPRALKTLFKPPADIHFTLTEAMLFAFIFGVDMDLCEPLVAMGDLKLWRLDFLSFAPGKEITEKARIHCLCIEGNTHPEVLLMCYNLASSSFIRLYHVDSYLRDQDMDSRRFLIRDVMLSLSDMITSDAFGDSTENAPRDLEEWPIEIARGVPNMGTSLNSSVWVLQWMLMEDAFVPNLPGVLKEMSVRIKTAIMMVMDPFNKEKIDIEKDALTHWEKFA